MKVPSRDEERLPWAYPGARNAAFRARSFTARWDRTKRFDPAHKRTRDLRRKSRTDRLSLLPFLQDGPVFAYPGNQLLSLAA